MIEYKVGISNSSTTTYRKEGKQCFCKRMDQNQKMQMIQIILARQQEALLAGLLALSSAMNGAIFTTTTWKLKLLGDNV